MSDLVYVDSVFSSHELLRLQTFFDRFSYDVSCRLSKPMPVYREVTKAVTLQLGANKEIVDFDPPYRGGCEDIFKTAFTALVKHGPESIIKKLVNQSYIHGGCRPMRYNLQAGITNDGGGWHHDASDNSKFLNMIVSVNSAQGKWEGGNLELGYQGLSKHSLDVLQPVTPAQYKENRGIIFNDFRTVHRVTPIKPLINSHRDILLLVIDYSEFDSKE